MPIRNLIPLPIRRRIGGWWNTRRAGLRKKRLLKSLRGENVQCNVCGWTGARFTDDHWHPGTICPNCGSQVRHRMLAALLDGKSSVPGVRESAILEGKHILHFAPERQLSERIQWAAGRYVAADFERGDCDWNLDISKMPEVATESFDAVIACDVLEHVPDDHSALSEVRRVLRPGGLAILTVPQRDPPAPTDEDSSIVSPEARERRFGQKDHVRMYGDDFITRLEKAGFDVTQVGDSHFPETLRRRNVLAPPEPGGHPLATNQRRIYLARRA